jgi:hypothetical protein
MKYEIFKLKVESLGEQYETPTITSLQTQKDKVLLCGLAFSKPALVQIPLDGNNLPKMTKNSAGEQEVEYTNLELEEQSDSDLLGVLNGLRPSSSGEAVFSVLHSGFLPGVLSGLLGKSIKGKKGPMLVDYLNKQESAGGALRHSVVHVEENGHLRSRSFKEPGILWDVAHVGDYVFGLSNSAIWREPYLKPDKRETLRSDLGVNYQLHRDEDGNFWFLGSNSRLLRMGQTGIKAQPTPLKVGSTPPVSGDALYLSAASAVDTWMYVTTNHSKTLLRVRINPVSREEEIQKVLELDRPITALLAVDHPEVSKLYVAIEGETSAEICSLPLIRPLDPEVIAPAPALQLELKIEGLACVRSLTPTPLPVPIVNLEDSLTASSAQSPSDQRQMSWGPKPVLWASVGRLGRPLSEDGPKVLRFSEL